MDLTPALAAFAIVALVFGGVVAAVVGLVLLVRRANRRRRAANAHWAASRGWRYDPQVHGLERRWQSPPFGQGSRRSATDVFTGLFHGRQALSFTYTYVTSSGENSTTHHHHVLALQLPVPLPWLQLSPDGAGSSIAKFFGGQDIEFESAAFNEVWRIQGPPGQYPFDFIHPRLMERLLAPDAVGRHITVEGRDLLLWVHGAQQIQNIDPYLNLLYGIVEAIPRHLWLNMGYDPLAGVVDA
ncbi:hypothetical protein EXU48_02235 [Occultella glacieicola]|uniref:DUF3137 domain-containing protein n=1 Tax=Occultella glacieicola TaxID=2518684 RepID=A0ABY2E943_9MICO|nr:hypothetical protein [Occultella glacieicola]TDE99026.1 hypothetical protein EXU48_02235 [Occultella glacieicola]